MKPTAILARHFELLFVTSLLLVNLGCTTPSKPQPTTVGPQCSIAWDKTNDPKVTGYQLSVIDQGNEAKKIVRFIPANTTKVSCKDAGASHEGLWDVTLQSCYDKSTCGPPAEIVHIHISAK
jgi:hypothetical protein